jgi:hypothetical protein
MGRPAKYPPEFRERAVRMARESQRSIAAVAAGLGINHETLRQWLHEEGEPMVLQPTVFNVLRGQALEVSHSPYGSVGELFAGEGVEVVWVAKQGEDVDPGWFSQARVDLILVVQGQLRLEFERTELSDQVLGLGDFIVLPANTRCRAYRWPRDQREASIFVAVYPSEPSSGEAG